MNTNDIAKLTIKCTVQSGVRRYRLIDDKDGHIMADNCDGEFLITMRRALFGESPHRALIEIDLGKPEPFIKTREWYAAQGLK